MEFEGLISAALEVYKILYPFIEKYGSAAFELLNTLIESKIVEDTIKIGVNGYVQCLTQLKEKQGVTASCAKIGGSSNGI